MYLAPSPWHLTFELQALKVRWHATIGPNCDCCSADARVVYTFDVYWEESDISWASRWDAYLNMPGGRVHWFSILNSLMVVLVMSSIVAMIMMRTIRRDLQRYEGLLGDAGELST